MATRLGMKSSDARERAGVRTGQFVSIAFFQECSSLPPQGELEDAPAGMPGPAL